MTKAFYSFGQNAREYARLHPPYAQLPVSDQQFLRKYFGKQGLMALDGMAARDVAETLQAAIERTELDHGRRITMERRLRLGELSLVLGMMKTAAEINPHAKAKVTVLQTREEEVIELRLIS